MGHSSLYNGNVVLKGGVIRSDGGHSLRELSDRINWDGQGWKKMGDASCVLHRRVVSIFPSVLSDRALFTEGNPSSTKAMMSTPHTRRFH